MKGYTISFLVLILVALSGCISAVDMPSIPDHEYTLISYNYEGSRAVFVYDGVPSHWWENNSIQSMDIYIQKPSWDSKPHLIYNDSNYKSTFGNGFILYIPINNTPIIVGEQK